MWCSTGCSSGPWPVLRLEMKGRRWRGRPRRRVSSRRSGSPGSPPSRPGCSRGSSTGLFSSTASSKLALSTSVTLMPLSLKVCTSAASRSWMIVGGAHRRLLHHLGEDRLVLVGQRGPARLRDDGVEVVDDVPGQRDVGLHLVELLRLDRRQRVLLRLHGAVLQREIDLGEGDRRGVGAAGLRHGEVGRHVRDAHLHALEVGALGDFLVRRGVAGAVVGDRGDVVARGLLVAVGKPLEDVALGVGDQVLRIAEDVGVVGDADRRILTGGEARAGDDDVDGAELQPLVDVGLLAELRGREDRDLVAPVGALADLLGRPDRLGVEGLGHLVDMRPVELGLRAWRRRPASRAPQRRRGQGFVSTSRYPPR